MTASTNWTSSAVVDGNSGYVLNSNVASCTYSGVEFNAQTSQFVFGSGPASLPYMNLNTYFGDGIIFEVDNYTMVSSGIFQIGYAIEGSTDAYLATILYNGSTYTLSFEYTINGNTSTITTADSPTETPIAKIALGYLNNVFIVYLNGSIVSDLSSSKEIPIANTTNLKVVPYIQATSGSTISNAVLRSTSTSGFLVGSFQSPNIPAVIEYDLQLNIPIIKNDYAPNVNMANSVVDIIIVDANGNNVLQSAGEVAFTLTGGATYNATTKILNLKYTTEDNHAQSFYEVPINQTLVAPYSYNIYLSVPSSLISVGLLSGTLQSYNNVSESYITDVSIKEYLPQSDLITIDQTYSKAQFAFPTPTNNIQLAQLGFTNASSYWKLSITNFTISGNMNSVSENSNFTILIRISEMVNGNPNPLFNTFGISVSSQYANWSYTLPAGNQIDLWCYNSIPTSNVVLSIYCESNSSTGTFDINNINASGLLIASPWLNVPSVITQLSL
jgi:hypothetical protein